MAKLILSYNGGILSINNIPLCYEEAAAPPPVEQPLLQFITDASEFDPGLTVS